MPPPIEAPPPVLKSAEAKEFANKIMDALAKKDSARVAALLKEDQAKFAKSMASTSTMENEWGILMGPLNLAGEGQWEIAEKNLRALLDWSEKKAGTP